ncbi:phosphatidylserine decarboxylase [Candidatus Endobugula sertula]|uniref:Phosphatidylserine decarboxylase proenzyme n=1 Tax=Candidatus Endobugula sertula TaxID=62101 RepID=A0A1D2QPP0_9GAMM|nr:phosphatidylserine decarboxylase [Candidatus Endobugula sertula]
MKTFLFIALQYLLPQHLLSRITGRLANSRTIWFKNLLIRQFIQHFHVDMSIAANPNPESYTTFNDFFTRPLAAGQRPVCDDPKAIASPADGSISQLGNIKHGQIFQAKGHEYSLLELVGGDPTIAKPFNDGHFATIYLSPKDYHRVHMPFSGTLQSMIHVPGDLFSVNETTANHVPRLFARNERLVTLFKTEAGPMAVILIGAMIVASIETVWAGQVTPTGQRISTIHYQNTHHIHLEKGDEMGRFRLGSTVIVLLGKEVAKWEKQLVPGYSVMMGESIGKLSGW